MNICNIIERRNHASSRVSSRRKPKPTMSLMRHGFANLLMIFRDKLWRIYVLINRIIVHGSLANLVPPACYWNDWPCGFVHIIITHLTVNTRQLRTSISADNNDLLLVATKKIMVFSQKFNQGRCHSILHSDRAIQKFKLLSSCLPYSQFNIFYLLIESYRLRYGVVLVPY